MVNLLRRFLAPRPRSDRPSSHFLPTLESLHGGSPAPRLSVRPQLERLEVREVLSAALNVVIDAAGQQTIYAIGTDHSVWAFDRRGAHDLSGYALEISASIDDRGIPEVFALGNNYEVWRYDSTWIDCGFVATAISANLRGTCFALAPDRSVWKFDTSWEPLGGYAVALSASQEVEFLTTTVTVDEVFVIGVNHTLWKNDGSWHNYGGYVTDLSATQDDEVFAVGAGQHLYLLAGGQWTNLGGYVTAISAGVVGLTGQPFTRTGNANVDVCYALGSGGNTWEYGPNGWQSFGGPLAEIAGSQFAGAADDIRATQNPAFYAVAADHTLWWHDGAGWHFSGGSVL
jgi:hypothetical protein